MFNVKNKEKVLNLPEISSSWEFTYQSENGKTHVRKYRFFKMESKLLIYFLSLYPKISYFILCLCF